MDIHLINTHALSVPNLFIHVPNFVSQSVKSYTISVSPTINATGPSAPRATIHPPCFDWFTPINVDVDII